MTLLTAGESDFKKRVQTKDGDILTTSEGATSMANKATFKTGEVTVAVIGTAEQHAGQAVPDGFKLLIKAKSSNVGSVYIGETKTIAQTNRTGAIHEMKKGDVITMKVDNFSDVWVDADNATDGVDLLIESD